MKQPIKPAIIVVAIVLVLGLIAAVGFYQDEVSGFLRLQGWNTAPVTAVTREFVAAAAKGDGAGVAKLVAANAPEVQPVHKDGEVVAFMVRAYGGATRQSLRQLCPNPEPKLSSPKLVFLNGGSAVIDVAFPGKHVLQLGWDRKQDGWKLVSIGQVK